MGTVVAIEVVGNSESPAQTKQRDEAIERATHWFQHVEACCNRFDASSELRRLCEQVNTPVVVSELLFEAVQFALAVADATNGAFDPTVGARMEARGFNRDYRTGEVMASTSPHSKTAVYTDVVLNAEHQSITLHQPLLLDLGAVAKGLAIDMAVRELAPLGNFMVDAGGDLYLGGHSQSGEAWNVGIRHPRVQGEYITTWQVSNAAVCTSGDYERTGHNGASHIVNAITDAVSELASVSVRAPSAMVADALATAAFALGPVDGLALLEQHDLQGLLVTHDLEQFTTRSNHVD